MVKNIFLLFFIFSINLVAIAQSLKPSDNDSKINFTIKNMGMDVEGSFKGLSGKMLFNPSNLKTSMFDVSVDVNTVNTGIEKRDAHLKKSDFFDLKKYPVINIKTTSIQAKGNDVFFAKAVLTMHGVSNNIQFDFIAKPVTNGYNFKGGFTINRKDYGVGGNSMVMGDNVKVSMDVVGKK